MGQIVNEDIMPRNKIRNMDTLDCVMIYVINSYSVPTSFTNLHDYFTKVERIAVERRTIAAYIQMPVDAKVLYRCERFDLESRRSLRGEEKYYLADLGIYFARNVDACLNYRPSLENALYIYSRYLFTLDLLLQKRGGVRHLNMVSLMKDDMNRFERQPNLFTLSHNHRMPLFSTRTTGLIPCACPATEPHPLHSSP